MSRLSKWIKKHCYKVTMIDRRPFGEITMRFWEPKNIIGHIYSWYRARKNLKAEADSMMKWLLLIMIIYLVLSWRTVVSFYMWIFSGHDGKWLS